MSDLNTLNSSINCSSSAAFTAARVIMGFVGTEEQQKQALHKAVSVVNILK